MRTGYMDPYVYPGTSVLKNVRDIRDPDLRSRYEMDMATRRLTELARVSRYQDGSTRSIFKPFINTSSRMCTHGQDVYAWAGEFRTVNISKSGDPFAFQEHIVSSLGRTFAEPQGEGYLAGADLSRFGNRGAYYLGEINAVHPFREGNGRTQREFIRQLGVRNGWDNLANIVRDMRHVAGYGTG